MTTDAQTISFKPEVVNVELYQGDDNSITVTVKDEAGAAIDLTGSTAKLTVLDLNGNEVVTLEIGDGIEYTDAAGGVIVATFSKAITTTMPINKTMRYDLQWTKSDTKETTLVAGLLTVAKQYTTT